ncbi:hypothetical protein SeLEV6574_g00677 [Synchytrium endobioticum]|uniref:Velvet domain-containing protein n=1 Tax=Synchytrium endobioticum TaxID=286115 RepID=A0A507DHH9_9FUNG|nr:hypothetical protein SeLEV6574_g00677 [Synchytrium endobioticum]
MTTIVGSGVEGNQYNFLSLPYNTCPRSRKTYRLTLRQQPKHSRMCGFGEKVDRRPVDPPPIIQLEIQDPSTMNENTSLYSPYYFMYASLISSDSDEELHLLRDGKTRSTTGSIVSSLYRLKDIDARDGAFFVFPDLSVRMEGSYRLKFSLFEIINAEIYHCASISSEVFNVYPAKKFPGMEESTFLSRSFAEQGLKIRIRKELRPRKGKRDASERDDSLTQKTKRGKKNTRDDSDGGGSASDDEGARRGTDTSTTGSMACTTRRQNIAAMENNELEDLRFHKAANTFLGPKHESIPASGPKQRLYHQFQYSNTATYAPTAPHYMTRPVGFYEPASVYGQYAQQPISLTANQQHAYQYYNDASTNVSLAPGSSGITMAGSLQSHQPVFNSGTGTYAAAPSNNMYNCMTNRPPTYNYLTGFDDRSNGNLSSLNCSQPQPHTPPPPQQTQCLSPGSGLTMHEPPKYGVSTDPTTLLNTQLPPPQFSQPSLMNSSPTAGNGSLTYGMFAMEQQPYHSLSMSLGNAPLPVMSSLTSSLSGVPNMNGTTTSKSLANTASTDSSSIPYGLNSNTPQQQQGALFHYNASNGKAATSQAPPGPVMNHGSTTTYSIPSTTSNSEMIFGPHASSTKVYTVTPPYSAYLPNNGYNQITTPGSVKLPPIHHLGQN